MLVRRAEENVSVPRAFAFQLFDDRPSIPQFMGWIKEVEVCGLFKQ
jgi:uncharacterized membrane protein